MKSLKWTLFLLVLGLVGCGKLVSPEEDNRVFGYKFTNVSPMNIPDHNCAVGMGAELKLINHDRNKSQVEVQVSTVGEALATKTWPPCKVGERFTISTETYVGKSEEYQRYDEDLRQLRQRVQERLDKIHRLNNPQFRLLEDIEGTPTSPPNVPPCLVRLIASSSAKMKLLGESSEDWLINYTPDGSGDDCPAGEILVRKSKER